MQITPAIKGQLTKTLKALPTCDSNDTVNNGFRQYTVRAFFTRKMGLPSEQAKHAARKYLAKC